MRGFSLSLSVSFFLFSPLIRVPFHPSQQVGIKVLAEGRGEESEKEEVSLVMSDSGGKYGERGKWWRDV